MSFCLQPFLIVIHCISFRFVTLFRRSQRPLKKPRVLPSAALVALPAVLVGHERSMVRPTVHWKRSSYSCSSKGGRLRCTNLTGFKKGLNRFSKHSSPFFFYSLALGVLAPRGTGWRIGWLGLISKGCAIIESSSTG